MTIEGKIFSTAIFQNPKWRMSLREMKGNVNRFRCNLQRTKKLFDLVVDIAMHKLLSQKICQPTAAEAQSTFSILVVFRLLKFAAFV